MGHPRVLSVPSPQNDGTDPRLLRRIAELGRTMPRTPLVPLRHDSIELTVKLECCNVSGSSKDRSAYWILRRAIERGDIRAGTTVVESSSGNFALAMAHFCRALDLAFVPVIDRNVNAATERQLRLLCDRVDKVSGGDGAALLDARLARVRQLRDELPAVYWPNQYANADAADAHDQLTGRELAEQLGRLDYLFVGVSTGGTLVGLSRRLRKVFPALRVVAVDAAGSVIFGGRGRPRHLPGIGSSMVPPLVRMASVDHIAVVPEGAAVDGCHDLLARHGIFAGGSTGSVYAAIQAFFAGRSGAGPCGPDRGTGAGDRRPAVAFLCADRGTAYLDTVYSPDWVRRTFDRDSGRTVAIS